MAARQLNPKDIVTGIFDRSFHLIELRSGFHLDAFGRQIDSDVRA
jgi:hypothetical protein